MLKWLASWLVAAMISFLRLTCWIRTHDDPREQLREQGQSYVYSVLHAHQVAIVIGAEPGTGAMVSRSADGQIIVPALKIRGCVPVRGSGRGRKNKTDKGGRTALLALMDHVRTGRPAVLAVDGPNGPRGHVHKGIASLSQETGAAVLNLVVIPSRRWFLSKTWDRMQVPKPFSTIHAYFAKPVYPDPDESAEQFRKRIEESLHELERRTDADEFALNGSQKPV